jgi:hypothetical protein
MTGLALKKLQELIGLIVCECQRSRQILHEFNTLFSGLHSRDMFLVEDHILREIMRVMQLSPKILTRKSIRGNTCRPLRKSEMIGRFGT